MYLSYYNLHTKPFQISTDPKFLWLGEKHKEALAALKYGIIDNKGFVLLTGDVGTGKTTLIHALINMLGKDVIVANISDPGLNIMDLYAFIAHAFGLNGKFRTKAEFLFCLKDFLTTSYKNGKTVLLIIDEAQRLRDDLLEEIRLISNIEKQDTKLINIFFVGQPEFNDILLKEKNRALRQRITVNYHIDHLNRAETASYIKHRLMVAGRQKELFTKKAIGEIYAFSSGYPRLINVICDYALLTGYAKEKEIITDSIIRECAKELNITYNKRPLIRPLRFSFLLITLLVAIATFFLLNRYDISLFDIQFGKDKQTVVQLAQRLNIFTQKPSAPKLLVQTTKNTVKGNIPPVDSSNTVHKKPLPSDQKGSSPPIKLDEQSRKQIVSLAITTDKTEKTAAPKTEDKNNGAIQQLNNIVQNKEIKSVDIEQKGNNLKTARVPEPEVQKSKTVIPPPKTSFLYFRFNSYDLSDTAIATLNKIAAFLNQDTEKKVSIIGHADSSGNYKYNKMLSKLRADIIKNYFIAKGIDPARIKSAGIVAPPTDINPEHIQTKRRARCVEIKIQ